MGDRDDDDDVKISLTIDYDKQWLNCVSAIGPLFALLSNRVVDNSVHSVHLNIVHSWQRNIVYAC